MSMLPYQQISVYIAFNHLNKLYKYTYAEKLKLVSKVA